MGWFESVEHNRWLSDHMQSLIKQAMGAIVPTGFAHTDINNQIIADRPIDLGVTARMTYVFSLGVLMGIPGCRRYADHGVLCMNKYFRDPENDGWFNGIKPEPDEEGHGIPWDEEYSRKYQFDNAYLVLGASAAAVADRAGSYELLIQALHDQERHWLEDDGLVADSFNRDFSQKADYHSLVSLLHTAEAYLAAAEATTDPVWVERAEVMLRFVNDLGEGSNWRLVEHFDGSWKPMPDYEATIAGRLHPFGSVIGHSMEWARLAVQLRAGLRSMDRPVPDYLLNMAEELFERARVDGWRRNGKPGFVASVDFTGEPYLKLHTRWAVCEGICATVALRRALLDDGADLGAVEHYGHCYRSWIDYLNDYIITEDGNWLRVLDEDNKPVDQTAMTRSDSYHGVQALLMARVPLWPPFASAISRGLLDHPQEPPKDRKSWNIFRRPKDDDELSPVRF